MTISLAWSHSSRVMKTMSPFTAPSARCAARRPAKYLHSHTPKHWTPPCVAPHFQRDPVAVTNLNYTGLPQTMRSDVRKAPRFTERDLHVGGCRTTRVGSGRGKEDLHDVGSVGRHLGPFPGAFPRIPTRLPTDQQE